MSDDELLYRAWLARRDEAAFAALARRHADLVHDVAWRVARDVPAAEDALQHALLALARDGTARPAEVGVRAWLARAAICRARDAARADVSRRRREQAVASARREAVVATPDPATRQEAEAALDGAAPEDAAVLALRYLHGLEYAELARVLDVAEATARVRVHRALDAVRASRPSRVDDARLPGLLAAAAVRTASPAAVSSALEAAARGAAESTGVAAHAAGPATRGGARVLRRASLVGAVALGVLGVLLTLRPGRDAGAPVRSSEEDGKGPSAPRLAGTPAPLRRHPPSAAAPTPPVPDEAIPETPAVLVPGTRLLLVRAVLLGTRAPIPCQAAPEGRRFAKYGPPADPAAVAVRPGDRVRVLDDWYGYLGAKPAPRAAVEEVLVTVPDPVPSEIEVGFPGRDDPRVRDLRLGVTDARTGQPLLDAYFDPGLSAPDLGRVVADADGRIAVPIQRAAEWPANGGNSGRPLLAVHAPGHAPHTGAIFDAEAWRVWDATGTLPVRLAPRSERLVHRARLRFLHDDGTPARDAYAETRILFEPDGMTTYAPLRPDADGRVAVEASDRVLLDVSCAGSPVESLVFSAAAAAAEGEREVRLPPLTRVRLTIADAPEPRGTVVAWVATGRRVVLDGAREVDAIGDASWDAADPGDPSRPGFRRRIEPLPGEPCAFEFLAPTGEEVLLAVRFEPDGPTPHEAAQRAQAGRFRVPAGALPRAEVRVSWKDREVVRHG